MPRDQNGNVVPPSGTIVNLGDDILPSQHNPVVTDYAAMIEQSLSRDGQGGMRAPLSMNNFRITNVGTATVPTDAVNMAQATSLGTPVGTVVDYAGANAPSGWMLCYGQSLSRAAYPSLFAAIGTTYGTASGSTFNLPDCRGRVSAGADNMGGAAADRLGADGGMSGVSVGSTGGEQARLMDISEIPGHTHGGGSLAASSSGGHTHFMFTSESFGDGVADPTSTTTVARSATIGGNASYRTRRGTVNATLGLTSSSGAHTHTITGATASSGSGAAHPNVQPTIVFNKIIKVQ